MTGSESADHKTITLEGRSPVIDPDTCRVVNYEGKNGRFLKFIRAYDLEAAGKLTATRKNRTNSIH